MKNFWFMLLFGLTVALAITLASCGGDDERFSSSPTPTEDIETEGSAADEDGDEFPPDGEEPEDEDSDSKECKTECKKMKKVCEKHLSKGRGGAALEKLCKLVEKHCGD